MADRTTNYGLVKPLASEFYDIEVQNTNMDKIDTEMKSNADAIQSLAEIVPTGPIAVTFEASDWVANTDERGGYTLEIPRLEHGRQSDSFCYRVRHNVGGVLRTNTWGIVGVDVTFDADTGAATLWAETAFAGDITFTG